MAIWSGPSSRNPGQSTPPLLRRQRPPVTTSTWSPPPPARQGPLSRSVSPRKVSGRPAGPVCPVVSGTRPVVVGMASVVGTAVVAGRVVEVARVVGTGLVVEESTRAGPDPPQPARAQAATTASATVTRERRPGKASLAPFTPGFRRSRYRRRHDAARRARARRPGRPGAAALPSAALLVVAGVPGAGKTTLLSRVGAPGSLVLDPEPIRARLRRLLGPLPYRLWRPLVHAGHGLRVLFALPGRRGLIVHDTGTRGWRRRLLVGMARRCGRSGHLLLLDVSAEAALEGQRRRRRAMRRSAFATHWRNWRRLRAELPPPATPTPPVSTPRAGPRSACSPGRRPPGPGRDPQPLGDVGRWRRMARRPRDRGQVRGPGRPGQDRGQGGDRQRDRLARHGAMVPWPPHGHGRRCLDSVSR